MASISELSNDLTANIDKEDSLGIVRLLRQSDAQLFSGWGSYPAVYDTAILEKLNRVSGLATNLLKAWLCSRAYNNLLSSLGCTPCFKYIISGGDESLVTSKELPEDDPLQGQEDLKSGANSFEKVMFFGITCGFSAPYIAGQIDYAMHQNEYTTILIGFNPLKQARDVRIEGWSKTCREVFAALEKASLTSEKMVVLNPIVGPEPITGSTRMKGGSMTKILLDVIFLSSMSRAFDIPMHTLINGSMKSICVALPQYRLLKDPSNAVAHSLSPATSEVAAIIDVFASTHLAAYRPAEGIASLISLAADCLRDPQGHLYYIGWKSFGILGLIDSSEMVDTYGTTLDEVRGFLDGGWVTCQNQFNDLSHLGPAFQIDFCNFESTILPRLSDKDCIIVIKSCDEDHPLIERLLQSPAQCGLLLVAAFQHTPNQIDKRYHTSVLVQLPWYSLLETEPLFADFAVKLILNVISTGANVLKGRVFKNIMINLTVANNKVVLPATSGDHILKVHLPTPLSTDIVTKLTAVTREDAEAALLKAIYRTDDISQYKEFPISSHITQATSQSMVIPVALLLASQRYTTVAQATAAASLAQSLRTLLHPKSAS